MDNVTIAVIVIIVLMILVGIGLVIYFFLIPPPSPTPNPNAPGNINSAFDTATQQWMLSWTPPQTMGNTGSLLYSVTILRHGSTQNPVIIDNINTTSVPFPPQLPPGQYDVSVVAYTSQATSPPGNATVDILGPPTVQSFDWKSTPIDFSQPIEIVGQFEQNAPLTSVTDALVSVTGPMTFTLPGTASINSTNGVNISVPIPTFLKISINTTGNQYQVIARNPDGSVSPKTQYVESTALWSYDPTTKYISYASFPSIKWSVATDPTLGYPLLSTTSNPNNYAVFEFTGGYMHVVYQNTHYALWWNAAQSTQVRLNSVIYSSRINTQTVPATFPAGSVMVGSATASNEYGSVGVSTSTYRVQIIPPSSPQNIRATYQ